MNLRIGGVGGLDVQNKFSASLVRLEDCCVVVARHFDTLADAAELQWSRSSFSTHKADAADVARVSLDADSFFLFCRLGECSLELSLSSRSRAADRSLCVAMAGHAS